MHERSCDVAATGTATHPWVGAAAPMTTTTQEVPMAHQIKYSFPHHRLEVYNLALEMAVHAKKIADGIPRGHRGMADQLLRASASVVLNIAEGANRMTPGAKRQRYTEARGECGEVAAAVELLMILDLTPVSYCEAVLELASTVGRMLTNLVRRFS